MDLGLQQKEVASQLGLSEATIYLLEANKMAPGFHSFPRLIQFLGYSPYPEAESIGERLKTYRKTNGITQKDLAKRLGVDSSTLAGWEAGMSQPQPKSLVRIQVFFDSVQKG